MKQSQVIILAVCAGAIALMAAAELHRGDIVLFNATPSAPTGFYARTDASVHEGAFVTVRAADVAHDYAAARQFTDSGDRFIKRVVANVGDSVCAVGEIVRINDRTVAHRALLDSEGRALPQWSGCRTLAANEVFLMGDTPDSFDSRYFGPVSVSDIEGVWRKLF